MALLAPFPRCEDRLPDGSFCRAASRTFRPCVLGFTLLAVAVALWGYSYRLSLYRHQPDQALRIPAAKLFVERNAVRASVEKTHTPPHAVPAALRLPVPRLRLIEPRAVLPSTEPLRRSTGGAPVPFRSPPVSSLFS